MTGGRTCWNSKLDVVQEPIKDFKKFTNVQVIPGQARDDSEEVY